MLGGSGHLLHVVGPVTSAELRDAQVLRAVPPLQSKQSTLGDPGRPLKETVRAGSEVTWLLTSGPSMETSSISSPMLSSLFERSDRWL